MKKKVLIYPSGAENAIEAYKAIRNSIHIEVIAASAKTDISELIYENSVHLLPYVTSEDFLPKLNRLIDIERIDFIIPTHDTVALELAKKENFINNAIVIGSDFYTNSIARYKSKTYDFFRSDDFCPSIHFGLLGKHQYPIFSKPDVGEGSKGTQIIKSQKEHNTFLQEKKDMVYMEFLPGEEYTVDCFTNQAGELLFAGARERVEVRMGISFVSREAKNQKEFFEIARIINSKLHFRGLWFFQVKRGQNGKLKLLEISTRIAGTMSYFRHKGINLPLLSVFDAMGLPVTIEKEKYDVELFRTTTNIFRFSFQFKKVYLDFDDTLIVNGKVQISVIAFLYLCQNLGKEVVLLTKHEDDIIKTLRKHKIDKNLFSEIKKLSINEKKSDFIQPIEAIFIDNWYSERKEVSKRFGMPVFDVDAVSSFLTLTI